MFTLEVTKDRIFELIDRLSDNEREEVLQYLIKKSNLDPDDTPDDIVIEGIRQGFKEALTSEIIPLSQMWEGIDVD